jgi:predicted nucleic acid-binding protein
VTPAEFLIDTSALARFVREGGESFGWDQAVAAGLVAICPISELEFFYSARSAADRLTPAGTGKAYVRDRSSPW